MTAPGIPTSTQNGPPGGPPLASIPASHPGPSRSHHPSSRPAGVAAVWFSRVTRRYGETVALDAVDLRIAAGETVALLGPNGAGKSTAIGLLLGLLQPSAGRVEVLGQTPLGAVRGGRVGAMLQESGLPVLARVGEVVDLIRGLAPRPMPRSEVLRRAGLDGLADRRVETLSGGELQRVRFALAIANDPDLLFLDEPTVAMDVESRRAFWADMRAFAAEGRTILFATHYLEEADQVADRIVVLDHGRIVADGTSTEIKSAGPRRRIRFRLADADRAGLAGLPAVLGVTADADRVELESSDPDATARALLRSDLEVHDLEISGPGLEAAFLTLTGGDPAAGSAIDSIGAAR